MLKHVDLGAGTECLEEQTPQSEDSPGIVCDGERLGRFIYRTDHVAADGALAPAALPSQDLLEPCRQGLSLARIDHMDPVEIRRRAKQFDTNSEANEHPTLAIARAHDIRCLRTESGRRSFCVIDDARPDFKAHALVRPADRAAHSRSSIKRLRRKLLELFAVCRDRDPTIH